MVNKLENLRKRIRAEANEKHAKTMQWFFKTKPGEYGAGDVFLGIKVPVQRKIAKEYVSLNFNELRQLLNSKVHEERLIALLILVNKYSRANEREKEKIYNFYIRNRKAVNNWDLVDLSAPKIVGAYLFSRNKNILFEFAESGSLWERRTAILSTFTFIKEGELETTFKISDILLNDKEDLIHKAVGWMLREAGKINIKAEEKYLKDRYKKMPRTMLRYAIEKFPEQKRKKYLSGKI